MIKAQALEALSGIDHGFFTRRNGVSKGIYESLNVGLGSNDDQDSVLENRRRVAASLNVDADNLVTPYQIHSARVLTVSGPFDPEQNREADALVTNTRGIAIGVLTADCGPVLFADAQHGVIGAAHAGWKGAFSGILDNTLEAMFELGARPESTVAVLGPTISSGAYEVGSEFHERFKEEDPRLCRFFKPSDRPQHFMFDLPSFIMFQLDRAGVNQVFNLGRCTYGEEDTFFSYRRTTHRREPDYGRQISAITLI
ncbi:peptidoglycan editing factor PgeF [Rhodobacteraceae bacterium RKSG542]|uniref:peptidoglycan editing factor PgeF n=1 Tax=Pseudovibrio flavus TaxID=2529854 RepID=UPI0012BB7A5D|nr:peptidoglycan editing factor PgeF [Pseudovibrio flavus]MTI19024.1 peptidoglycan editing factor PgeF [Pseudovibrio flavus]